MEMVTGIFTSSNDAERAMRRLHSLLSRDNVTLLIPGQKAKPEPAVELTAAEQPGVGKAIGGVAGAAVGIAGGVEIAAAVTTVAIPGVGPVIALGMLGGALLGFLGATAGEAVDRAASSGLPEDEFFVYEDALRGGRSVLIASCEDESTAASVRKLLEEEGAEGIDAAREMWWIGLRSAEQEHYSKGDEKFYRLGFEAAVHARYRDKEYDQVLSEMNADLEEVKRQYPGLDVEAPFRRGFERGREYYQGLRNKVAPRAA